MLSFFGNCTASNIYFTDLTWLGATKWRHTGTQTTIARQTDDAEIVGAVLERGEAAKSDDYSHIVQPYRFQPCQAVLTVRSLPTSSVTHARTWELTSFMSRMQPIIVFQPGIFLRAPNPALTVLRPARFT